MLNWLYVFIGGGIGSLARLGVSRLITSRFGGINPLATLISNVLATLILGYLVFYFSSKDNLSSTIRMLVIVGFCGGFSTFSTLSFETFELIKTGYIWIAVANVLVSLLLGVGSVFILSKTIH